MNLRKLIIVQEKKQLKQKEIISQCISKKIIVQNDFKKAISDKNKTIKNSRNKLSKYTKKQCENFYKINSKNSELRSNYYKNFLPYLIVFWLLMKFITKRWI
jgi:formate-dependent nitrite reductase cytochrome c552 subunit